MDREPRTTNTAAQLAGYSAVAAELFPDQPVFRMQLGNWSQQARTMVFIVLMSMGCYELITHYFLQTVQIVGKSMAPTLQEGSNYLLQHWTSIDREPDRRDVVVIRDPADHGLSVKRIVARPGDSIVFHAGKVIVNHYEFKEHYLPRSTRTLATVREREKPFSLGPDQYYVLGDNRQVSIDSRIYGPVSRENILGLLIVP